MSENNEMLEFERDLIDSLSNIKPTDPNKKQLTRLKKDLIISYVSDNAGCGHIRNIFPVMFMNSVFGKEGVNFIISPTFIWQEDMLARSRSILFQRQMNPEHLKLIKNYKRLQEKFKFKMVYDIDDYIYGRNENQGGTKDEGVPSYNFGHLHITPELIDSQIEIMNLMDVVCVSTEYLRDEIKKRIKHANVIVVPNTVPRFMYGGLKKRPITSKIIKPRVIYTGSPTHYLNKIPVIPPGVNPQFPNGFPGSNAKLGDFESTWLEWVNKNVKDDKIDFIVMGGTPWFFEGIKNKSNVKIVDWVPSFDYASTVKNFRADAGIMPLVPNQFNRSKSSIKAKEYFSLGILAMGTLLDGYTGPYDFCPWKINWNAPVEDIDKKFWESMDPDQYNYYIDQQYKLSKDNSFYTEDKDYVQHFMKILSDPKYKEDWSKYKR